jgi:hypothetical protein
MILSRFGIKDVVSNKIMVTSGSEVLIKLVFESGFKTRWKTYEIVRL